MSRLSVAVIQGGPSSEAEVSRSSALGVAKALTDAGHVAVRIELNAWLSETLRTGGFDVVFPVVHGAVGEDGSLQGLLEILEMPYVGSNVLASAVAMNKALARKLFQLAGLPVAKGIAVPRGTPADARAAATRARKEVSSRLVVKPCSNGSAIGVGRFEEGASLNSVAAAIEAVWQIDEVAMVEHFARGREVTCSVIETLGPKPVAALTEIHAHKDAFYTYEARYAAGRSVHTVNPEFPEPTYPEVFGWVLASYGIDAHIALGCRDLSRVDMIVGDDGNPAAVSILEVNTMPGFTATSLYPEAAAFAGLPFPKLCDALVQRAVQRGASPRNTAKPLPT
ncbi:MAG: D-alanine--D-alanine ligase [Polyangiaceae bacterium]